MRSGSTALVAIVTTLYVSCTSGSTATITNPVTAPLTQLPASHSAVEAPHDGTRSEDEEDRGLGGWFKPNLAAGAETLSRKELKALVDRVVKDPVFYNNLAIAGKTKRFEAYAAWKGLDVAPKYLAQRMAKAGFGGDDYKHFVDEYTAFLNSGIRVQ